MNLPRSLTILGVVAATASTVVGVLPATADTPTVPLDSFATTTAHQVTLPTGDTVLVNPATSAYTPQPAPGSGAFESFTDPSGDHYVVPAIAAPYLGRQLDPSLFDVSALVRNGDETRVPVDATFNPGTTPTAPAGVTFTSVTGGTATGYVASAPAFAAALRKQIGADIAAGHHAGTAPLFGGLAELSLAGAPAQPSMRPQFAEHLLELTSTDPAGAPANAVVLLMNTDQENREVTYVPVTNGLDRLEVPSGHYAAMTEFDDYDVDGNPTAVRLVAADNITVPDTGTTPTVAALNEAAATATISATTPKPATERVASATLALLDPNGDGQALNVNNIGEPRVPVLVSPIAASTSGTVHFVAQWSGISPDPAENYQYDLAWGASGIPAGEAHATKPSELATVKENFYGDPVGGTTGDIVTGATDASLLATSYHAFGNVETFPSTMTDYLGGGDGGDWQQEITTPNEVLLNADPHVYQPGHTYSVDWGHGPVAAGLGQWNSPQLCDACVAGDTLSLAIPQDRDSNADHSGFPYEDTSSHFTLYQGDTKVFDQDNYYGAYVLGIPATPTVYRGVFDLDETGISGFSQSTRTHTEETVRYTPALDDPLPSSDSCDTLSLSLQCEVLPALTLGYDLSTDKTNTSTAPVQTLGLTVGHVGYRTAGARFPITSVTVSVSFDNGTTWQRVPAIGALGHYAALWPNPRAGGSPSLRVTATDSAGNSISQTVTAAYTVGKHS
ncbi:MAG TPA: hypothetical protein VHZ97_22985 [Pseudonocardiaceae bacterium]|nr:hypothetical protein [Pseudonocardiaceae bacterium]